MLPSTMYTCFQLSTRKTNNNLKTIASMLFQKKSHSAVLMRPYARVKPNFFVNFESKSITLISFKR